MFTIRDKHRLPAATLRNQEGLLFQFLDNGAIFRIHHQEVLINQVLGSPLEGDRQPVPAPAGGGDCFFPPERAGLAERLLLQRGGRAGAAAMRASRPPARCA
jgi:hypothetical protein